MAPPFATGSFRGGARVWNALRTNILHEQGLVDRFLRCRSAGSIRSHRQFGACKLVRANFGGTADRFVHLGEGDPSTVAYKAVALPGIGLLQLSQLGSRVRRLEEAVDADGGSELRRRMFARGFGLFCGGPTRNPAAPREADNHGQHRRAHARPEPHSLRRSIGAPVFSNGHCFSPLWLSMVLGNYRNIASRYNKAYHIS